MPNLTLHYRAVVGVTGGEVDGIDKGRCRGGGTVGITRGDLIYGCGREIDEAFRIFFVVCVWTGGLGGFRSRVSFGQIDVWVRQLAARSTYILRHTHYSDEWVALKWFAPQSIGRMPAAPPTRRLPGEGWPRHR